MIGTDIEHLIKLISRLPGLGPRSARRAALHLLTNRETLMLPLSQTLARTADIVCECTECHTLDTHSPCRICTDPTRDAGAICVVEDVADLWAIEKSGAFRGRYHVLGGTLSALDGIGPEDLAIPQLVARVRGDNSARVRAANSAPVREVIMALNATIDGQTTAHYIADHLKNSGVAISQLAHGVPIGGQIDHLDDGTLSTALKARKAV